MNTTAENLRTDAEELKSQIAILLGDDRRLYDVNQHNDHFVVFGTPYRWDELSLEQHRLKSRLLKENEHFFTLVAILLSREDSSAQKAIAANRKSIEETISQTSLTCHSTTGEALAAAAKAIDETISAVECLSDPGNGTCLLVPDTNALIARPRLERWDVPSLGPFELVLVPSVLSELDSLKIEHRNPEVRDKSKSIIRQIKEYRRRGSLTDGVTIVAGRSSLRAIATEPNFARSLPWLDDSVADDRILASFLEVVRQFPRSPAVLVSGDINLQNKAEFARLPYLDTDEIDD